jgi:hypothetical protein
MDTNILFDISQFCLMHNWKSQNVGKRMILLSLFKQPARSSGITYTSMSGTVTINPCKGRLVIKSIFHTI